jgi:hypothetical protein
MTLDTVRESTIRAARTIKEHACRKRPTDILSVINAYRGDDQIAAVVPAKHNRTLILQVFRACAIGFDADTLALTFEAYAPATVLPDSYHLDDPAVIEAATRANTNPLTGQPWGPGEMGEAVKEHDAIENGWIHEIIGVVCANRAGDTLSTQLPFRYSGHHLVWKDRQDIPRQMEAEGVMMDAMIAAMQEPSAAQAVPYQPTEGTRAERDVLAAAIMMQKYPCRVGLASGLAEHDRIRVLRQVGIRLR